MLTGTAILKMFLLLYAMLNGMVLPWLWFGNNTRLLLDWGRRTDTNMHRPLTRQSSYNTVHLLENI